MKVQFTSILKLMLVLCLAVVAVAAQGQGSKGPDFGGRWVSESVKMRTDRPLQRTDADLKIEMTVTQLGNELRVKESTSSGRGKFARESLYYLDGRGESNKGFTDGFVYESKTEIKDQKLLIEGTVRFPPNGSSPQTEEWELSADGKTLTIKTKTAGGSVIRYEKIFRLAS